jgi:nucleoside-diphosphate-sugar epimerase
MKILITGATGFIGQHLLEELSGDKFSIRIIKRSSVGPLWIQNTNFETYVADISDKSTLEPAFEDIDVVINLAAEKNDPGKYGLTNIEGVHNIIELSAKYGIKKIIHLSSISVFGVKYSRKKIIIDNNFSCKPKTGYGTTKLQSEKLLNEFGQKSNTEIIIIRSSAVFGEHQPSNYLLDFFTKIKNRESIPRIKNTTVNYVYVKDIAHAIRFFLKTNAGNKTITVGESIPFNKFIFFVSEALHVTFKIRRVPSLIFGLLEIVNYFGIQNLKEKFHSISNRVVYDDTYMRKSVTYKYGIKEGIERTIRHYKL